MDESRRGDMTRRDLGTVLPEQEWVWDDAAILYLLKNDYHNSFNAIAIELNLLDKGKLKEDEFWSDVASEPFLTFEEYAKVYGVRLGKNEQVLTPKWKVSAEVQTHVDRVNALVARGNEALGRRDLVGLKAVLGEFKTLREAGVTYVAEPDCLRNPPKPKG